MLKCPLFYQIREVQKKDSRKNKNCEKTSVPFQVRPSGEMAVVQGAEVNVNVGKPETKQN